MLVGIGFGFILAAAGLLLGFGFADPASAVSLVNPNSGLGLASNDLIDTVIAVVRWILGLVALVAVIMIIYGGYVWMTAGGDSAAVERAKKIILNAVIGLVVTLLSFAITFFIINLVNDATNGNGNQNTNGGPPGTLPDPFVLKWYTPQGTDVTDCVAQLGFNRDPSQSSFENGFSIVVTGGVADGQTCTSNADCASDLCTANACVGDTLAGVHSIVDGTGVGVFTPSQEFSLGTAFTATAQGGGLGGIVAQDNGEALSQTTQWSFTTAGVADDSPPHVDRVAPADGATGVARECAIQVEFSKNMLVSSLMDAGALTLQNNGSLTFDKHFESPKFLSATPTAPYAANETQQPLLESDIITDTCGLFLDGDESGDEHPDYPDPTDIDNNTFTTNWTFDTGSTIACTPEITNIAPNPASYDGSYRAAGNLRVTGKNFGLIGEVILNDGVIVGPLSDSCMGADQAVRGTGTETCLLDWQDNLITLQDPPATSGRSNGALSGNVFVEKGGQSSNPQNVDIISPYVQRVDPQAGPPGTFVTISGSQFGTNAGNIYLRKESDPSYKLLIPNDLCNVWEDQQVVAVLPDTVPTGTDYYFQIETSDSRYSNGATFVVNSDPLAPGICPASLACGDIGDTRNLLGRFTAKDPGDTVLINGADITDANIPDWNEVTGNVTFILNEELREGGNDVRLQDNGLMSNSLTFSSPCNKTFCDDEPLTPVCDPNPGLCGGQTTCNPTSCECTNAPFVVHDGQCDPEAFPTPNPRPNASEICLNARVHVMFSEDMNDSTLNTNNIILEECNDAGSPFDAGSCFVFGASPSILVDTFGHATYEGFTLDPDSGNNQNFNRNKWYRVRLTTDVLGQSGYGLLSDYEWTFRTKDTADLCEVQRVDIEPRNHTFQDGNPLSQEFRAVESGEACQLIDTSGQYDWRIDPTGAPFGLMANGDRATVTTTRNDGSTTLIGRTGTAEGIADVRSEFGVVECFVPADCNTAQDKLSNTCSDSDCIDNKCTPDITVITPNDGAQDDLVSVHGCYFGNYQSGTSRVDFTSATGEVEGVLPTDICAEQYLWDSQEVRVRVPNGAVTGSVFLTPQSHPTQRATSDQDFDVNTNRDALDYVCLEPSQGPHGTDITVRGERFGTSQGDVVFTKTNTVKATIGSWSDTEITALVNYTTDLGINQTFVEHFDGTQSNTIPFEVFQGGSVGAPCSDVPQSCQPNNNNCNAGLVCNTQSCICETENPGQSQPNPEITSKSPDAGEDNVCRNRAVEIVFDQEMDASTLVKSNLKLVRTHGPGSCVHVSGGSWWNRLAGFVREAVFGEARAHHLSCNVEYNIRILTLSGETQVTLEPIELLQEPDGPEMNYKVTVVGGATGVKSQSGLQLAENGIPVSEVQWEFRTQDALCELDSIKTFTTVMAGGLPLSVEAFSDLYTCSGDSCADDLDPGSSGNQHAYSVRGYTTEGDPITFGAGDGALVGVWADSDLPDNVVSLQGSGEITEATVDASRSSGLENLKTTVTQNTTLITKETDFTTQLSQCDDPWPSSGPFPYHGGDDADFADYHYQTMYCKDSMSDPMTVLDYSDEYYTPSVPNSDELLAEFYLRSPDVSGSVGILIYENEDRLSAERWFENRFPGKQAGRSTTIGGYPAIESENGTYISFSNKGGGGTLYANIMVVEHSVDAGNAIQDIYRQVLSNMTYNTNMMDENKSKISRDLVRINDLSDAANSAHEYYLSQEPRTFPSNLSGSFIIGHATSKWPVSWGEFSNILGTTVNSDPLNTFNLPDTTCTESRGYDESTCWNQLESKFYCPSGSQLYHYQSTQPLVTAFLYAALEYTEPGSWVNATGVDPCSDVVGSACSCYNYQVNINDSGFEFVGYTP